MRVVAASVDRVGYPCELSVKIARNLDVLTGCFPLARIQFPVPAPRPAGKQRAVVDVLGVRVEVFRREYELGKQDREPISYPRISSANGWIGGLVCVCKFLLNVVSPHVGE